MDAHELISEEFARLGIARLADLVAARDLSQLTNRDIENYARMAISWTSAGGTDSRRLAGHFAGLVVGAVTGEHPDMYQTDGKLWIRGGDGDWPVTTAMVAHWERCWALLDDEATARGFLELVPQQVRAEGQSRAAATWETAAAR